MDPACHRCRKLLVEKTTSLTMEHYGEHKMSKTVRDVVSSDEERLRLQR